VRNVPFDCPPCADWIASGSTEPVPDLTPDSLAQSFVQTSIHEPSDSVLLDNLSESIHASEELGIGPAEDEGMFTNIFAAFMDALKSRLSLEVRDVTVNVQHLRYGLFNFILVLAKISLLPSEENMTERLLLVDSIEAYLREDNQPDDESMSIRSDNTITSPSPPLARSPTAEDDNLLSQSMMFSSQEASSLYMSAYSQPSQSHYVDELESRESVEDTSHPKSANKGFRFFYFEHNLVFRVATDPASVDTSSTTRSRHPPVLQSALPTAHLILNPDVNLLPSISLISTILSLSSVTTDSTPAVPSNRNPSGGLDFSWLGGVVIHFGAENTETMARFADWKVVKRAGDETLTLSMGIIEIVTSMGQKILCTKARNEGVIVTLNAKEVDIRLPEVDLRVDLDGLKSLQSLFRSITKAWLDSVVAESTVSRADIANVKFQTPSVPRTFGQEDDDDWNANLLVEDTTSAIANPRLLHISLRQLNLFLPTNNEEADDLVFAMEDFHFRILSPGHFSVDFMTAQLSVASSPLILLSSPSAVRAMVNFVSSDKSFPTRHVRTGQMTEILDDFLVGEGARSDDAWGMIRTDAVSESAMIVKVRLPRVDLSITDSEELRKVESFVKRIQGIPAAFSDTKAGKRKEGKGFTEIVLEYALGEGLIQLQLSPSEKLEGKWEGLEGTIIRGIGEEDTVGVSELTKLSLLLDSATPRQIIRESICRVYQFMNVI
jgi:hypothetical protein